MSAEAFLLAQAPFGAPLLFTVIRERGRSSRGGLGGKASFRLLLEPPKQGSTSSISPSDSSTLRPLALARRRGRTLYTVTPAGSSSPLGLLKSNVWGTAYLATSLSEAERGGKRKEKGSLASSAAASAPEQLATVSYRASSFLGPRGPRQLAALVPTFSPPAAAPESPEAAAAAASASAAARTGRRPLAAAAAARDGSALELSNVSPRWSASAGAFTLDFGGRVTAPSVKNFQLVAAAAAGGGGGGDGGGSVNAAASASAAAQNSDASGSNKTKSTKSGRTILLQFGKTGNDSFSMDVRGPLTPLQGFLICLTALDGKLARE